MSFFALRRQRSEVRILSGGPYNTLGIRVLLTTSSEYSPGIPKIQIILIFIELRARRLSPESWNQPDIRFTETFLEFVRHIDVHLMLAKGPSL